MRSTELDEHPRLTTLAGADRLVRLGVETYDWMRESALGRATTPPPATAVQQLRDAALLDPHSPDRPQLETHWLQLLRRALNSPVRLDLVSIDGARAWTTTIHVAGQMLLALDQVREVVRDDGALELGRRSSALTLAVGRVQRFSEFVIGLVPQRPAFGAEASGPAPEALIDAPAVAQVQIMVSSTPGADGRGVRERSWYALGEEGTQLAALVGEDDQRRLDPVPTGRFAEFLRADLVAAIQQASDGAARPDASGADAAGPDAAGSDAAGSDAAGPDASGEEAAR